MAWWKLLCFVEFCEMNSCLASTTEMTQVKIILCVCVRVYVCVSVLFMNWEYISYIIHRFK
jgi:hypothetical protein